MKPMTNWPQEELAAYARELAKEYEEFQKQGLKLNMSRGVPGTEQLDMCEGMLTVLQTNEDCLCDGVDTRNYGGLDGLPGAKKLFADILGLKPENIIVGGNSSLNLMYDAVARAMTHGVVGSVKPWCECPGASFSAPCPGYDRHFAVTEHFGFEMINIPMDENGPGYGYGGAARCGRCGYQGYLVRAEILESHRDRVFRRDHTPPGKPQARRAGLPDFL